MKGECNSGSTLHQLMKRKT